MHYCVQLLTKELPSEEDIRKIMQPYNDDVVYGNDDEEDENVEIIRPVFTWDWYQIGGRYKARIKIATNIATPPSAILCFNFLLIYVYILLSQTTIERNF